MNEHTTRPSVHLLCTGAFLQAPVTFEDGAQFVPLKPLGFKTAATWLASYAQECGASVDQQSFDKLVEGGSDFTHCVAIVCPVPEWQSAEDAEKCTAPMLDTLRELLSWATGDIVEPIGYVVLGPRNGECSWRATPPRSNRRIRLGFGNTGDDFVRALTSIREMVTRDERFAFALSMFHDANRESNIHFKIARYFFLS